jgi:hypothetical protein
MTAKNPLAVERTIGFKGRIWTGLSAPKTQKAGRQNGGDLGQFSTTLGFNRHRPKSAARMSPALVIPETRRSLWALNAGESKQSYWIMCELGCRSRTKIGSLGSKDESACRQEQMKKAEKDRDPPLSSAIERYTYGPDGSRILVIERQRRGFLKDEVLQLEPKAKEPVKPNSRLALTTLCQVLRAELDAAELPTDKWPVMPIELDFGYDPQDHGIIADEDIWIGAAEDSTEPLTKHRIAADLLHIIQRLLKRAASDEDLLADIHRAMKLFAHHTLVGEINELAISGERSRLSRAQGPRAKVAETRRLKRLILTIARKFWVDRPNYRGRTVKTAIAITDKVNRARRKSTPNCRPLSPKTIGDHLSAALSEENQRK